MTNETIFLIILLAALIGSLPAWPYSASWGYAPTTILVLLIIAFIIWAVAGGRPLFANSNTRIDTRSDVEDAAQDVGQSLKETGRDVAQSIRKTLD